jgi:CRP-like cAMP-binding protein
VFKAGEQIECLLVGRTGALGALAAIGFSRAVALTVCHFDSHAWRIPAERMRAAVRQSPVIAQALWNCSQAHIGYGLRVGACNGLHTLEQRLARWLLCASQLLETAEVRLPQDVLADVLGAQRSSINPLLQRFQRAGIISVSRSKLEILDRDGMQRRACECYTALARGMRGPSEEASAF